MEDRPIDPSVKDLLDRFTWIDVSRRPGDALPTSPPPALPPPPLFGHRRTKRWPLWAEALVFCLSMVLMPMAASLAFVVVALALPFWCIWIGWRTPRARRPSTPAPRGTIRRREGPTLWDRADRFSP